MDNRRTEGHDIFVRLMWQTMKEDPDWMDRMDTLVFYLPPGETWPVERKCK